MRGAFQARVPVFLEGDSQSYLLPAWDLFTGQGFAPELRRAPLYPLFIAGSFLLAGAQLEALVAIQHLLGVVTVVVTYALARRWMGVSPSAVAALLIAISGPLIISEHYVMSEALFGTLVSSTTLALVIALQGQQRRWYGIAGLLIGLTALCRPVAQVLFVLVPIMIVLLRGWRRETLIGAGLVVGVGVAVLAPWALRNFMSHGTASSAGGLGRSLIARTVKYDEGFFNSERVVRPGESPTDLQPSARQIVYRKRNNVRKGRSVRPVTDAIVEELGLTPGQADGLMRDIAFEAIREHPTYYLQGSAIMVGQIFIGRDERLAGHWRQRVDKDWDEQWEARLDPLLSRLTPAQELGYGTAEMITNAFQPARLGALIPIVALLGLLAGARTSNQRMVLVPGVVGGVLVVIAAALDGPVPRYRYPIDPLIAVCVGTGLSVVGSALAARPVAGRLFAARQSSPAS